MKKRQQIERLHHLFATRRRRLSTETLCQELGIDADWLSSLLSLMTDHLLAPIDYCSQSDTYAYLDNSEFTLPRFWLSADEAIDTANLGHAVRSLSTGFIDDSLGDLNHLLKEFLRERGVSQYHFDRRVRYHPVTDDYQFPQWFSGLCCGVIERRQLALEYVGENGKTQSLTVCPQLVLHRLHSWLLVAWCHRRRSLRTFNIARIRGLEILPSRAREIAQKNLEKQCLNELGYNQQQPLDLQLLFSGDSAFEVANQQWHPQQVGRWQGKEFLLTVPLVDQDELLQKVLAHLPNVQVLSPSQFAERLRGVLSRALERHSVGDPAQAAEVSGVELAAGLSQPSDANIKRTLKAKQA
jgi:predicted DNA-binding transcriptional regulator YafY